MDIMPLASCITPRGHFAAHIPQEIQRSCIMTACPPATCTAPAGQTFSQIPQPIQPRLQTALVSFADARLQQKGCIAFSSGISSISCCGHIFTHFPQPMHFSRLTSAVPLSFKMIACLGHTSRQLPPPRHPYKHPEDSSGPEIFKDAQSLFCPSGAGCRSAAEPAQRITATRFFFIPLILPGKQICIIFQNRADHLRRFF